MGINSVSDVAEQRELPSNLQSEEPVTKSLFNDLTCIELPSAEQHGEKASSITTQDDPQHVISLDDNVQHLESPGSAKKSFSSESRTARSPLASSASPASLVQQQKQQNGNCFHFTGAYDCLVEQQCKDIEQRHGYLKPRRK